MNKKTYDRCEISSDQYIQGSVAAKKVLPGFRREHGQTVAEHFRTDRHSVNKIVDYFGKLAKTYGFSDANQWYICGFAETILRDLGKHVRDEAIKRPFEERTQFINWYSNLYEYADQMSDQIPAFDSEKCP